MNATVADSSDAAQAAFAAAPAPAVARQRPLGAIAGAALLAAAAVAIGWQGDWWAVPAALLGALACRLLPSGALRGGSSAAARSASSHTGGDHNRVGAEVMVATVVPVWSRQMEVTRDAANDGLAQILEVFSNVSGQLGQIAEQLSNFSPTAKSGALDDAVEGSAEALAMLTGSARRAFAERDAVVAELGRCVALLGQLKQLGKTAREVARHTRLVAFNASIEAHRSSGGGKSDGGGQAVAAEVRMLAGQMGSIGEDIESLITRLSADLERAHLQSTLRDTSEEELAIEVQMHARAALGTLLGSIGQSLQGCAELDATGRQLSAQLEEAFMHFQFGDRIAQMLSIVANDMNNFAQWVAANPRATQSDAANWLAALEASYTMEEQRSHHHGNVHIERSTATEFF